MNKHKMIAPIAMLLELGFMMLAVFLFFDGSMALSVLSGISACGCLWYLKAYKKQHGYRYKTDIDIGDDAEV